MSASYRQKHSIIHSGFTFSDPLTQTFDYAIQLISNITTENNKVLGETQTCLDYLLL